MTTPGEKVIGKTAIGVKKLEGEPIDYPPKDMMERNSIAASRASAGSGRWVWGKWVWAFVAIMVLVVVILVAALVPKHKSEHVETEPPVAMNFATGVSLITDYNINATISHRLARTVVTMEVANAMDCTSIHAVTLQLPLNARVTSLKTLADDGCTTTGVVKELEEARETFVETATQGLPGAYVEARDSMIYSLQVSLPPMGRTVVELVLEELLRERVGAVEFHIPFVPNEQVDRVALAVTIMDTNTYMLDVDEPGGIFNLASNASTPAAGAGPTFYLDLGADLDVGIVVSPYSIQIPDAREHDLPRVVRGSYNPGVLPDQGVLFRDGDCFEHTFLPSDLTARRKNIFFLVDTSTSSGYWSPETSQETKTALKAAIDSLSPEDTLTIQAFSARGTEELWGSAKAIAEEKAQAKEFVDKLETGSSSNLHGALLEGLLRAKSHAEKETEAVTLLVLLSSSWASAGATNRSRIASEVWKLNEEGKVKIFSVALPGADVDLLKSIAIMNGGVTTDVASGGTTNVSSLMTSFFDSEFGNILLSDVHIDLQGDANVVEETPRTFPVLTRGTELVVRGLLSMNYSAEESALQATTTAYTNGGKQSWTATAVSDPFVSSIGLMNSRCFQSYAHSRITQLLQLRDVAILLGDGVVEPIVSLTKPCDRKVNSLADCIKTEALALALKAQIVTTGLTGLVTVDDDQCLPYEDGAEICMDGTSKSEFWDERESASDGAPGSLEYPYDDYAASSGTSWSMSFNMFVACWITVFFLDFHWRQ